VRIGFYIRGFPGAADYSRDYTEVALQLARAGHDVTALLLDPSERAIHGSEVDGVRVRRVAASDGRTRLASAWRFARREAPRLFDVFFAAEWWNAATHVLARGLAAAEVPTVVSPWASLNEFAIERDHRARAKRVTCRAIALTYGERTPALQLYDEVDAGYAEALGIRWPWFTAPLGVYDDYASPAAAFDWSAALGRELGRSRVLLFNARLDLYQKGYDLLVEGFRLAAEGRGDRFRTLLVLSGRDPTGKPGVSARRAAELARPLVRSGRARFLGELSDADRSSMLAHCHAFIYPSRVDGPPRPLREALNWGTPILVTPQTGLARWVREFGAGVAMQAPTASAVRDAVVRFDALSDAELVGMRAGAERLAARLRWDVCWRDYDSGLSQVLKRWAEGPWRGNLGLTHEAGLDAAPREVLHRR
jgi:glycosyltransferase involved in cell wall biosynthesis